MVTLALPVIATVQVVVVFDAITAYVAAAI
jgi:hypothetical protein